MPHTAVQVAPISNPSPELLARWLALVVQGDTIAFEALFLALYDGLCQYAEGYVRSAGTAEEIVSDVFLALWAGRERLRIEGSVSSYLYVAVRNKSLNHLRRRKAERTFVERAVLDMRGALLDRRNDVEDYARGNELFALAQRAIDALPTRIRETYLLYYQHGMTYAQIAEIMGVSVRTVENQLARSMQRLWRGLHDEFDESQ
jgi:RNA polymerase sigma-70 factor (ECF subfamily)